jgi:hypothetical protein
MRIPFKESVNLEGSAFLTTGKQIVSLVFDPAAAAGRGLGRGLWGNLLIMTTGHTPPTPSLDPIKQDA